MPVTTYVTDAGLETDLVFHHGVDLPEFAAFPLLDRADGRSLLDRYYRAFVGIARLVGAGLLLETPTWRANPDWGARLGYAAADLDRVNRLAVHELQRLRDDAAADLADVRVAGMVGPRGDGYRADDAPDPDEAAEYHRPQLAALAGAGADLATAYTLTTVGEAIGISRAAASVGLPIRLSFTVETDGRLPDGTSVSTAITAVDAAAPPDGFLLNCAHPDHIAAGLGPAPDGEGGAGDPEQRWRHRVIGLRVNASRQSHAALDEATELDDGDPVELARDVDRLRDRFPALAVVGGCCGTDARHVAALWGVYDGGGPT